MVSAVGRFQARAQPASEVNTQSKSTNHCKQMHGPSMLPSHAVLPARRCVTHAHAHARTHTHTHARTRTRAHTHTLTHTARTSTPAPTSNPHDVGCVPLFGQLVRPLRQLRVVRVGHHRHAGLVEPRVPVDLRVLLNIYIYSYICVYIECIRLTGLYIAPIPVDLCVLNTVISDSGLEMLKNA